MYSVLLSKIEYGFPLVEKELKKIVNENMKVIVLPWAFPIELDYARLNSEYFKEGEKKYNKYINPLINMGIKRENIKILNCYDVDNFENFKCDINSSDILLLPGGNPEMFFSKVVQETEILYEIKHYKGIIIGESAGACLQFKRYFITAKNNYYKYFAFYDGFGVLNDPFYIDVHSINNRFYMQSLSRISKKHQKKVYAIFNDGAILYNRKTNEKELFGNVIEIKEE